MDWAAVCTAIALPFYHLNNGGSGEDDTLRASDSTPPDAANMAPQAVVIPPVLDSIVWGGGYATGQATIEVLILLDPRADVPRRAAALLSWMDPALDALAAAIQLGLAANLSGARVTRVEPLLAGRTEGDYAGLPFDLLRLTVVSGFRVAVVMAP